MNIRPIILCVSVLLTVGCGRNQKKAESFSALPFPDVMPPAMIEEPSARAEYMALHWWDALTDPSREYPCDSLFVSGVRRDDVEQKFANWINVLNMTDLRSVEKAMSRLYERAVVCEAKDTASNIFETFTSLVDKYLYDPNSPLRNEDHYAFYAARLAVSDLVEPVLQEKYARQVRLAGLNRVGTRGEEFIRFTELKQI